MFPISPAAFPSDISYELVPIPTLNDAPLIVFWASFINSPEVARKLSSPIIPVLKLSTSLIKLSIASLTPAVFTGLHGLGKGGSLVLQAVFISNSENALYPNNSAEFSLPL